MYKQSLINWIYTSGFIFVMSIIVNYLSGDRWAKNICAVVYYLSLVGFIISVIALIWA